MDPDTLLLEVEEKMEKCFDHTCHEFSGVRTGKASPALVDTLDVYVSSYGTTMKLKSIAVISAPEPRMLVVQPHDPSTSNDITRAIRESKLGLNPIGEGRNIRLPIPELSEERRRDMVKLVKGMGEDGRISVRAVRREGMDQAKKLKANNLVTEDGLKDLEAEIQKLTDTYIKKIDEKLVVKEKDIMTV